jgi:hypothetical protein
MRLEEITLWAIFSVIPLSPTGCALTEKIFDPFLNSEASDVD